MARHVPRLLISGPSGSGKSSLASLIGTSLRCAGWSVVVIHQDDFFATPKAPSYWDQANRDTPAAVDMVAFRNAIEEAADDVARLVAAVAVILKLARV